MAQDRSGALGDSEAALPRARQEGWDAAIAASYSYPAAPARSPRLEPPSGVPISPQLSGVVGLAETKVHPPSAAARPERMRRLEPLLWACCAAVGEEVTVLRSDLDRQVFLDLSAGVLRGPVLLAAVVVAEAWGDESALAPSVRARGWKWLPL